MRVKNFEKVNYINALTNDLESIYRFFAKKLGVPDSVMRIFYAIYDMGDGCLLSDVCQASGLSKQTINSALRKLEKEDVLFLKQDKGKSKRVYLTDRGKVQAQETAGRLFAAECNAFNDWSETEVKEYFRLIKKFNDSFREQVDKINLNDTERKEQ